jgi:hypothetical protein
MFNSLQSKTVGDVVAPDLVVEEKTFRESDKEAGVTAATSTQGRHQDSDDDPVDNDAQAGVRAIEATTSVWSKRDLIIAYCL